jgi:hypothetical protein
MTLLEMLYNKPDLILLDALESLEKIHLIHYGNLKPELIRFRLSKLLEAFVKSVETSSIDEMTNFISKISDERYELGFELYEVQTVINILEESLWKKILIFVDEDKQISAMKQVSDILSKGKERLVNEYANISKKYTG